MATSTRFAVATHVLCAMALKGGEPVRSEDMAARASTNSAVIRKILSMTNRAGLTTARLGQGGGALLARPAKKITLADVYDAVGEPALFSPPRCAPDADCPIGRGIGEALEARAARAYGALRAELARTTIDGLARELVERDAA